MLSLIPLVVLTQTWSLDVSRTELVVKVWKTGAAAGLAHDHVVRATKVSGQATLDAEAHPESLTLELTVGTSGLVPDEPEVRKRHGVEGAPVPDADREKVKANLLGADQLDASKHPTIRFVVTKVTRDAAGLSCAGQLTLHGVTKDLRFPITVSSTADGLAGDARVRLRTSDFGVTPFSAALGLIRNKDEVELVAHVVVTRS